MKIIGHWGFGITAFYIAFVLALVAFVIFTTFHKVDLVDENYYEKEIEYQNRIDKINRANRLEEKMEVKMAGGFISVNFPKNFKSGDIKGQIVFFRPSDKKLDFTVDIAADDSNRHIIKPAKMKKGLWKVKVDWAAGDSTYYNEETIVLN